MKQAPATHLGEVEGCFCACQHRLDVARCNGHPVATITGLYLCTFYLKKNAFETAFFFFSHKVMILHTSENASEECE